MAEAIFKHVVERRGLTDRVACDSAGTASYHVGDNPDFRSIECCESHGVKVSHKARQFTADDLTRFDYVMVMDKSNLQDVQATAKKVPNRKAVIKLLGKLDPEAQSDIIEDPYYGGVESFEVNFQQCLRSCTALLDSLDL